MSYIDRLGNSFIIDTNPNVGIGTTIPRNNLDIIGNIIVSSNIGIGTTRPRIALDIRGSASVTSGNVGIGTTLPNALLQIGSGTSTAFIPLAFNNGTNLTTIRPGAFEYDGNNFYVTPNTNYGRATIPATIYTSGSNATPGVTSGTNYPIFPTVNDRIRLLSGTYHIQMNFSLGVSGSTTVASVQFDILGGGTASGTCNWASVNSNSSGITTITVAANTALGTPFTATASLIANPRTYMLYGEGILKITSANGTIMPSYRVSTTITGGTASLNENNCMIIQSLDTQSAAAFGPVGCGFG